MNFRTSLIMVLSVFTILSVLLYTLSFYTGVESKQSFKILPNSKIQEITKPSLEKIMEDTDKMLIERVSGTSSIDIVESFIVSQFSSKWIIEKDEFTADTPLGKKQFTNIIASFDSCHDCDFIVLAAHYDSKYFTDFKFVAATDSAVPCAILLDIARSLEKFIAKSKKKLGVKIVFFDGEEAFVTWTDTDSIYGARHLADKWDATVEGEENILSRINAFVLLDLLGAPEPMFYQFTDTPPHLFEHLVSVEQRLQKKNIITNGNSFFARRMMPQSVQDDHIPFQKKGVKIVHLIPLPFPQVWHTARDDRSALDLPTIDNLAKILKVFVAEVLDV